MTVTGKMSWPDLFPEDEIPGMIRDVLDSCRHLLRPPQKEKRPEEALSRQVYLCLRRMEKYRRGPLEPHLESWLPDLGARADIRFSCGKGVDTYFVIEAKRLFVTYPSGRKDSLVREYVHEGMMRFVSGKYAPYQQSSAMLGYVHDQRIEPARVAIEGEMKTRAKELCLVLDDSGAGIRIGSSAEYSSHQLEGGRRFTLYHLLVRVSL